MILKSPERVHTCIAPECGEHLSGLQHPQHREASKSLGLPSSFVDAVAALLLSIAGRDGIDGVIKMFNCASEIVEFKEDFAGGSIRESDCLAPMSEIIAALAEPGL